MNSRIKSLAAAAALVAAGTSLTACGSSKAASGTTTKPSISQRYAAAKACLPVVKPLTAATPVLKDVIAQKISPTDAVAKLAPLQAAITKAATDNPNNPASAPLTKLSTDIAALQKNPPKAPAAIKTAATGLLADASALSKACLGG